MLVNDITIEHIYECINDDENLIPSIYVPLRSLDLDELNELVEVMSEETRKNLKIWTAVHKSRRDIQRMETAQTKVASRPVLTAEQRTVLKAQKEEAKPGEPGYYKGIFDDDAKRENYTPAVWRVRHEFLLALDAAGGASCKGCVRGSLIRKYTRRLQELGL